jgi:hypothetical protein
VGATVVVVEGTASVVEVLSDVSSPPPQALIRRKAPTSTMILVRIGQR